MDRSVITSYLAILTVWLLTGFGLYLTSLYNFILFHITAESFSIVIAFSLFIIAWNTRQLIRNNYLLFIGIAYLFVGMIDIVHTLAYKGLGIFRGFDANLPTQLWILGRYLESLSLLAAPWFIDHRTNPGKIFAFYLTVTVLSVTAIFSGVLFPDCFVEGQGLTPFKIVSEYIICLILLGSLVLLLRRRDKFDPEILRLIFWSILFTIISELAFTLYVSVYGLSNLIGHYFKILSFYLIYKAIIVTGLKKPYSLLLYDLQRQREELQVIIDASPIMIFYKDQKNRFIRVNKTVAETTGLPKEELEGRTVEEIYPHQAQGVLEDDREVIATGKPKIGIIEQMETPAGLKWVQTDKIPYRDEKGDIIGVIGFAADITERKRMEDEIREMSFRDPLTELYNRRGFISLAEQLLKAAHRSKRNMLLVFVDIDGMKWINDTLGHEEGDRALIETAHVLKQTFRESDIIARIGGDEFAIFAFDAAEMNTETFSKRFQLYIDECNTKESRPYKLAMSWGAAIYNPERPISLDELMSAADKLMYINKKAKTNTNI